MDGWNTSFLLGWPIFRCYVSFRECSLPAASTCANVLDCFGARVFPISNMGPGGVLLKLKRCVLREANIFP